MKIKKYDGTQKFHDVWTIQLSWAKLVLDENGQMHRFFIWYAHLWKGKKKLLAPKLDSLFKHQGHCKTKVSMPKIDVYTFYFNKDFVHAKNEHCYTIANHYSILDHLQANVPYERKQIYIQFVIVYHLFAHKCPMIDYESLKDLFQLLKVKSVFKKHWIDSSGWGMVEVMCEILLEIIKATFAVFSLIVITTNKVTIIANI